MSTRTDRTESRPAGVPRPRPKLQSPAARAARIPILLLTLWLSSPGLSAGGAVGAPVRPSALAGTWYPADPSDLRETVDRLLDSASASPSAGDTVRAVIAPHAGYAYSGATAARAFAAVRGRAYRRVVILAPSHRSAFSGLSIPKVAAYETPLGQVPLDGETIERLRRSALVSAVPQAHEREHAIEIQLPLLQRALKPGWRLVPVLVGGLEGTDYAKAAELLRPLADSDTLILVSSDFTHYGPRFDYLPFPPGKDLPERIRALDEGAVERILARDGPGLLAYRERTGITVCGIRPLAILLLMLPAHAQVERLGYATSGELTGDWDNSVSYVALAITAPAPFADEPGGSPEPLDRALHGPEAQGLLGRLHRLATLGVDAGVYGLSEEREAAIRSELNTLPQSLAEPAGAFVTLKSAGALRGCVGHLGATEPVASAVLTNGANAARNDPRFEPVTAAELRGLEIEISVLSPLRPIASPEEFRVGEQGIVLRKGLRSAVYLPEVAPLQGWDREETLSNLSLKAGLPADAWRDGASFEVFTTTKYQAPYASDGQ